MPPVCLWNSASWAWSRMRVSFQFSYKGSSHSTVKVCLFWRKITKFFTCWCISGNWTKQKKSLWRRADSNQQQSVLNPHCGSNEHEHKRTNNLTYSDARFWPLPPASKKLISYIFIQYMKGLNLLIASKSAVDIPSRPRHGWAAASLASCFLNRSSASFCLHLAYLPKSVETTDPDPALGRTSLCVSVRMP